MQKPDCEFCMPAKWCSNNPIGRGRFEHIGTATPRLVSVRVEFCPIGAEANEEQAIIFEDNLAGFNRYLQDDYGEGA